MAVDLRFVLVLRTNWTLRCSCPLLFKWGGSPVVGKVLVSQTSVPQPRLSQRLQLQSSLLWSGESLPMLTFVDSGADENFIDCSLVAQAQIPTQELDPHPMEVTTLNGNHLARITHRTVPLTLILSGNHQETIQLLVISSPLNPVVLGLPWLILLNPHIDWINSRVVSWSVHCHSHCLMSGVPWRRLCLPSH